MKKKYLVIAMLLMFVGIINAKALVVGDCKVLVSFKLSSSLDEDSYICKGTSYGNDGDGIYYSGTGNVISLNNFNAYYFTNYDEKVTLNIKGNNNISLLHISDVTVDINGSGSLKFKQNSFAKKVINGEAVYQFSYNDKTILTVDKKIFEGTLEEFVNNYNDLVELNKLPKEYNEEDYKLVQVEDYTKMSSLAITDLWFDQRISTKLDTSIEEGFGIIKELPKKEEKEEVKEEKKEEPKQEENVLQTDNVVLITEKKVNKKYKLKEEDLKTSSVAKQLSDSLEDGKDLVSLYDVSVYDGKELVEMKNGKYTIKIKIDEPEVNYENYQIIYVSDSGEIEEYFDGKIEDGYVVFETTHLSQYGIIANQVKVDNVNVSNNKFNFSLLIKISILLGVVCVSSFILLLLIHKSKNIQKRPRKRA